ncbi:TIGR04282 family arsenosugar biosynthesis glycosyltransferase [Psychromicrobium xiongbiense]|uniref:TIGR04282 family arsenosugar biosynthesis glycosyltransferase n=1 Tax=Psychromicrobium xiongbiense TaxID=3051184 RepID=UPI002555C653|nr:DUF2064 domain-containing protein [Psychromicrobium sp. YIM S02556]
MTLPDTVNWLEQLTIAVIAKECLPGRVKTRLTPPLSPAQAAALAQTSLSQTLETVRQLPARYRLLVMDGCPLAHDAAGFRVLPQVTGGLDLRLAAVCAAVEGPLLILGMDTPQVSAAALDSLFRDWSSGGSSSAGFPAARARRDAWLGLAEDGGFWALALAVPDPALIRGVPMSTPQTGGAQYERLLAAGLSVGMLPPLRDVDQFQDALAVARLCPETPFAREIRRLECRRLAGRRSELRFPALPSGAQQ